MLDNCIFCGLVNGKLQASRVYEDNHTLAFMNQRQANLGHVLVIPKTHYLTIYELDGEIAAHLFQTVVLVAQAIRHSLRPDGLTIWQSNGVVAGQEIYHVHIHVFPRAANDQFIRFYPKMPALQERTTLDCLAETIRAGFSGKTCP